MTPRNRGVRKALSEELTRPALIVIDDYFSYGCFCERVDPDF